MSSKQEKRNEDIELKERKERRGKEERRILPMRKRLRFLSRESSNRIVVFDRIDIGEGRYAADL